MVYINYFEYDLAGNRTHLHYVDSGTDDWTYYTYNIENQLTIEEKGGVATYYTYDPAGALISKITDGGESTYDYTYEGQMDEYASGDDTVYFVYNADKKRIQAKRDGTVEKYALSGNDVVADYDGDDALVATYNTPALDSNLTKKVGENVYFYVADGLGSIRNIVDSDETEQNSYDYKAFGAVYGSPTENIANRYRFTAREWESIPSLHFYRARMMGQTLGRFISKDPEFAINLYIYGNNLPIWYTDPFGLIPAEQAAFHYDILRTVPNDWKEATNDIRSCAECCYEILVSGFRDEMVSQQLDIALKYIKGVFYDAIIRAISTYFPIVGTIDDLIKYSGYVFNIIVALLMGDRESAKKELVKLLIKIAKDKKILPPGTEDAERLAELILSNVRGSGSGAFDTKTWKGGHRCYIAFNEHWQPFYGGKSEVKMTYIVHCSSSQKCLAVVPHVIVSNELQEQAYGTVESRKKNREKYFEVTQCIGLASS